ncbi:MAG: S4 domain-containing protein [Candidatus Acidiferrales bacterium]
MLERLQKIIARAGIASRRHAEELIKSGLVTVNGQTITELGSKADESTDHIKVQGKLLRPQTERVYLLLNKPPEVVSTMIDPEGRRTLADLLHGVSQRVFPVGRLEYHSMGLVFLTNDGELANEMLKAHQLLQTYHLKIKSLLTFEEIEALSRSTGAQISRLKGKDAPWYEVTLSEARRDALRNRLFQTGHPVEKIKRVKIGNLAMESLSTGHHRPLSEAEVATLRKLVHPIPAQPVAAFAAPENQQAPQPLQFRSAAPTPAATATSPRPPMQAPRRPFVKRRPYQPKPKPGERPRPTYDAPRTDTPQPGQSFRPTRPSEGPPRRETFRPNQNFKREGPRPTGSKPFSRPYKDSRPAASGRPSFKTRDFRKPDFNKPDFNKPDFKTPGFQQNDRPPRGPKSSAPWRSNQKPSEPGALGRPNKNFRPGGPTGPKSGTKSGAPWKSKQRPSEPGAFGRPKQNFKPAGPRGLKSGAPKRNGPRGQKPNRGKFTGPKGRS